MKTPSVLVFTLAVVFIAASACGDSRVANQNLEIQAMQIANSQKSSTSSTTTITQTQTQTQTSTRTVTTTVTSGSTSTSTGTRY